MAVTPDAPTATQILAQDHEIHLVTPYGLHTPYPGHLPPEFGNPHNDYWRGNQ